MSLNERMSRCREVAGKIETLVGQPLPDTLACIRGCIADVCVWKMESWTNENVGKWMKEDVRERENEVAKKE